MSDDQSYKQCLEAFLNRDYESCVQLAVQQQLATDISHEISQMLLISLQRLGQTEDVERFRPHVLAAFEEQPWNHSLLRFTLGEVEGKQVLAQAQTETQTCQLFY